VKKSWFAMMSLFLGFSWVIFVPAPSLSQQKSSGREEGQTSRQAAGSKERISLSYATNAVGSGLYTISVGQSQVISRKTNIDLKVQPTAGALVPPRIVFAREAFLGITSAKILGDAFAGTGEYSGKKHSSIRALQAGQVTLFGIVANESAGIKTISDLKGKKVTWNILTSDIARNVAFLEMKAYGIDGLKDVKMLKAESTSKAIEDLAQGRTDAVGCSLGGAKLEELATSRAKAIALAFDPARIDVIQREMPAVFSVVSKKVGPVTAGIPVVGTPEVFFAHRELDEETAYRLVKALLENQEELKLIHRDFAEWTQQNAVRKLPIPYHPGAIRCYKERGIWSPQLDQLQTELLK
jgi:uncharacterized protein